MENREELLRTWFKKCPIDYEVFVEGKDGNVRSIGYDYGQMIRDLYNAMEKETSEKKENPLYNTSNSDGTTTETNPKTTTKTTVKVETVQQPLIKGKEEAKIEKREPLTNINKGDIVVFYDTWNGKLNKGTMLIKSFDYGNGQMPGSAPRCLYGQTYIDGIYYGDWAPGGNIFYRATEEEIIDFFKNSHRDRLWPNFYMEQYPNIMGQWKPYIEKYVK